VDLPVIGDVKVITDGWGIPFMMQAWWMFCLCSLFFFVVSLLTPRPDSKSIQSVTWDKPIRVLAQGRIRRLDDPRLLAGYLLVIMIVFYYVLR
jgi:SSS family solute:Na+ symporter